MSDGADMLRAYLADRDEPCPGCAYNLRGLAGTRCPECNQELRLRVGLLEPRLGAYLGAMCGLLAGLGMGVTFLGFATWMSMRFGAPPRGRSWGLFGIPAVCIVVLAILTAALWRRRSRVWFRNASGPQRAGAILACWGATIGAICWFFATVLP